MTATARSYRAVLLSGLIFISICTVGVTPVGAIASTDTSETAPVTSVRDAPMVLQTGGVDNTSSSSTTNSSMRSIRYVDPSNISTTPPRETSLERAGLQIAESLGVRLEVSANELVEQNYSAAESNLGEAYRNDAIRLTEIAEATENASDDQLAEALAAAGENQREAVNKTRQFRTLYTEYQRARASQNEARAREVAKELAAATKELNQTSTSLTSTYANLSDLNETRANRAQQRIEQALSQAEQLAENAQQSTYIETRLSVTAVSQTTSPTQPLSISGRLEDIDGTPLTNRTVELTTPRGLVQSQTNTNGEFTITHAPIQISAGETPLTVRYVPQATAGFRESETTVSPQISSLPSTLAVTSAPERLSNASTTNVSGEVMVAGQALAGVPVRVLVGETVLEETETTERGTFQVPISPPITTQTGEYTLTIEASDTGQAVEPTADKRPVMIEPVETNLTVSATRTNTTTVAVDGQLTRTDEQPLPPQLLPITIGNQAVGYVQTDQTGQFGSKFTLTEAHPAIDGTEQTTPVAVQFTNETTHIAPARASTTVTFFPRQGLLGYGIPALVWVGGIVGGVLVVGGVIAVWYYRNKTKENTESAQSDQLTVPGSTDTAESPSDTTHEPPASLFERAEAALDTTPEQALQLGYLAARRALAEELDDENALSKLSTTHWEFYRAVESTDIIDEELTRAFESLTQAYEHSTYTTDTTTTEAVEDVLVPIRSQLTSDENQK